MSGSGKKLWKQKGTGRARIASIRSPLWKGGGNVHGPQSRDWSQNLPKKMRRGALRSALSARLREGNLVVIDEFVLGAAKTKDFVSALGALGLEGKTLIVDTVDNENLLLASRNVKRAPAPMMQEAPDSLPDRVKAPSAPSVPSSLAPATAFSPEFAWIADRVPCWDFSRSFWLATVAAIFDCGDVVASPSFTPASYSAMPTWPAELGR